MVKKNGRESVRNGSTTFDPEEGRKKAKNRESRREWGLPSGRVTITMRPHLPTHRNFK